MQLFRTCDELARTLQMEKYTIMIAKLSVKAAWEPLNKIDGQKFRVVWEKTITKSEELDVQTVQFKYKIYLIKRL